MTKVLSLVSAEHKKRTVVVRKDSADTQECEP